LKTYIGKLDTATMELKEYNSLN